MDAHGNSSKRTHFLHEFRQSSGLLKIAPADQTMGTIERESSSERDGAIIDPHGTALADWASRRRLSSHPPQSNASGEQAKQ